jgi:serine/threonine protein kinase
MKKKETYGDWELIEPLGQGGNGSVWLAKNSKEEIAAIKLLWKLESKAYARFIAEIKVVMANSDIEGILPILDFYLPEKVVNKEIPWYVMPVAEPLEIYLDKKHVEDIAFAIRDVSKILFELHSRSISHRDVKPENLLVKDNKVYLADFGLVDFPDKVEITSSDDAIGAKWTMAPEMRREGSKADGKPADVYSLAKTFWILTTRVKKGFDGQYNPYGINGLSKLKLIEKNEQRNYIDDRYRPALFLKPIDDLLRSCTNDEPSQRPDMKYVLGILSWWVSAHKDLEVRNPVEWQDLQKQLFPTSMPQRVIWEDLNDIVYILNTVGSIIALNHMFYPEGGGMDLEGAKLGLEPDTVELVVDVESVELIKPKRLVFENFNSDTLWNYFRLEIEPLEPTGIGGVYRGSEELVEIEPLHYINRSYWDEGRYEDQSLPAGSRLVSRYINGNFVLFAKTSFYNRASSTYDGRHNQMTTDEFREYIAQKVKAAEEILADPKIAKLAAEKDMSMYEVLNICLEKDFHKDHMERFRDKTDDI